MSTSTPTSSGLLLSSLPCEVLELIVHNVDKTGLKALRQLNKSCAELCTPVLFREVVLVSFTSCLNEFLDLLKSTDLGQHMRKITYDDRWHHQFWDFCRTLRPGNEAVSQDVVGEFHDAETLGLSSDGWEERRLLTEVFERLQRVERVEVKELGMLNGDDEPPGWFTLFMKRIAEGQTDQEDEDKDSSDDCNFERIASEAVVWAMVGLDVRVKVFTVKGIDFQRPSRVVGGHMPLQFLKELDMMYVMREATQIDSNDREEAADVPQFLRWSLRQASGLETIHLRGSSPYDTPGTLCNGRECLIRRFVQANCVFIGLQNLSIQDTPIEDTYLVQFLKQHTTSLKRLELRNVVMLHEQTIEQRECLISLFNLVKNMSLTHFRIEGLLANGGNQTFHFQDTYSFPSQVDEFLKGRERWHTLELDRWGCGHPGIGCVVGGLRYPAIERSRWFDSNAASAVEKWVLDPNDIRQCPMQKFAVQEGESDYVPAPGEGSRWSWHVYVWDEENWEFQYRQQSLGC